jgi:hypothetical protein
MARLSQWGRGGILLVHSWFLPASAVPRGGGVSTLWLCHKIFCLGSGVCTQRLNYAQVETKLNSTNSYLSLPNLLPSIRLQPTSTITLQWENQRGSLRILSVFLGIWWCVCKAIYQMSRFRPYTDQPFMPVYVCVGLDTSPIQQISLTPL